jgi:hypothetical protein
MRGKFDQCAQLESAVSMVGRCAVVVMVRLAQANL